MGEIKKVVVLSRSFGKSSDEPLEYLKKNNIEVNLVRNDKPDNTRFIAEQIGDADAVIVGSDVIDRYVLDHCPNLRIISKHGVGLDSIDLGIAEERGIAVRITPYANNESVADLTILLILVILRDFRNNVITSITPDWTSHGLASDLYEKTVGLVGCGKIGMAVAKRLAGFDCKILIYDPCPSEIMNIQNTHLVSLEELLKESDIVSLHAPLNDSTYHLIDAAAISLMKKEAVLINTSRGALVDEDALFEALRTKRLKGAGVDVFSVEPPVNEPMLTLDNFVGLPHIAPHTREANYRMGMAAARNVVDFSNSSVSKGLSNRLV